MDFLSSLTLAGAAEKILGKLLEKEGKEPVLHRLVRLTAIEYEKENDVFNFYNKFRNAYKHLDEDLGYVSTNYMAMIMIERGCCNYRSLLASETKQIAKFRERVFPDITFEEAINGKVGFAPPRELHEFIKASEK